MTPREAFIDKALMIAGSVVVIALLIGRYAI